MERKQIRLDEQSETDLELIRRHYGLTTRSAAIRFALREVARLIEAQHATQENPVQRPPTT
jgi:hypothetical protein